MGGVVAMQYFIWTEVVCFGAVLFLFMIWVFVLLGRWDRAPEPCSGQQRSHVSSQALSAGSLIFQSFLSKSGKRVCFSWKGLFGGRGKGGILCSLCPETMQCGGIVLPVRTIGSY